MTMFTFERPEFKPEGDAYVYTWKTWGIGVGLENFRQSSDGLKAEMTVLGTDGNGHQRPLEFTSINLSSTTSAATLVKALTPANDQVPWQDIVKYVRLHAKQQWAKGEPTVNLQEVEDPGETRFLVEKLLPAGETTVIFADGGTGKSFVAEAIGIAVCGGYVIPADPNSLNVSDPGPVLYMDWETHSKEARRRASAICRGWGIPVPEIYYRRMTRPINEEIARVRKEVDRLGVRLVIVDSIAVATSTDYEGKKGVGGTLDAFNCLRWLESATRLVLGHISAEGARQKNGAGRLYGTVFGQNAPRSVWEMRSSDQWTQTGLYEVDISLWHRKSNVSRKFDPIGWQLVFDDASKSVTLRAKAVEDNPELIAHGSLSYQIRAVLKEGAKDAAQIARMTGAKEATVQRAVSRMADVINISEARKGGSGHKAVYALEAKGDDEYA